MGHVAVLRNDFQPLDCFCIADHIIKVNRPVLFNPSGYQYYHPSLEHDIDSTMAIHSLDRRCWERLWLSSEQLLTIPLEPCWF